MQIMFVVVIGLVMYGDLPRRIEGVRKYLERGKGGEDKKG